MNISFWGQEEIIDENLYDKMNAEIERLINCNDSINFLFYGSECCDKFNHTFMEFCWQIAYKTRIKHPKKTVKFIKVVDEKEKNKLKKEDISKPFGAQRFDEYFSPSNATLQDYDDYICWLVNESDYVFCYLYDEIEVNHIKKLCSKRQTTVLI